MSRATFAAALRPVALIGLAAGVFVTYADPDVWGHIRFGLDILSTRHVVTPIDPYSFTADHRFLYHEWLGGVIMAGAYRLGGAAGLLVLKALLALAILALVWQAVRRARFEWRWGGTALAAWGTLPLVWTLRPQLWTGVGVVIVCRVLTTESRRWLWALPAVFALWANLHGGWIVGGALVALWTGVAWIERRDERWPLLLVGAASLAATLLNPYGAGLWTFLLETVRFGRDHVSEWQPIWRTGPAFIVLWALAIGTVALSVRRCGRPPLATIVALACLACAAARVNRLGPLFVLAAVALLSRQWPREEAAAQHRVAARGVLDLCAVSVAIAACVWLTAIPRCMTFRYAGAPDAVAAEALRHTQGRLVTSFDWGEYAIWHFGPALKVSIDGRRETLYTDRTLNEQLAIATGEATGLDALARITPEYVWLPSESTATAKWLWGHGYRQDVRTDRSFIAVRGDLPPLSVRPMESEECFPGP
jgi:hypothetical protein